MVELTCVDLRNPDLDASVALVRRACLDCGFFYVVNHGISSYFMEQLFEQSRKFFALRTEEKMKHLRNKKHRGYTPFFDETLDPSKQINGDYKEGYYIGPEMLENDPRASRCFCGPNVWPSPDLLPQWRNTMERYHVEALTVGKRVSRLIALALDLSSDFFDKPGRMDDPIAILRLLHYSGEVSNPENGVYGAGAHSDYGLLTLLATDGTPGLQICKEKYADAQVWESVQPLEGAFIVNLGDMLERWSNGRFRSTLHRVLTSGKERYSIAFFMDPNYECLVECLETCTSKDNPAKFPPILCGRIKARCLEKYLKGKSEQHLAKEHVKIMAHHKRVIGGLAEVPENDTLGIAERIADQE